jgi:hypothetical protein
MRAKIAATGLALSILASSCAHGEMDVKETSAPTPQQLIDIHPVAHHSKEADTQHHIKTGSAILNVVGPSGIWPVYAWQGEQDGSTVPNAALFSTGHSYQTGQQGESKVGQLACSITEGNTAGPETVSIGAYKDTLQVIQESGSNLPELRPGVSAQLLKGANYLLNLTLFIWHGEKQDNILIENTEAPVAIADGVNNEAADTFITASNRVLKNIATYCATNPSES